MKYEPINNQLFKENRARFTAKMQPNSIAIFHSNDEMPRSADSHHLFRQNSDLFYLTGIDQEKTILILFPDCVREEMREVLLIRKSSPELVTWEGHKFTKEEAREISGIEKVVLETEFWSILPGLMFLAEHCYLNLNEHGRTPSPVLDREMRFAHTMRMKFPLHHYHRAAPILHALRAVKSTLEVALIQHACNITEKAFRRVLQFVKPGVYEYEVEAEILHEFLINRATGPAYSSIIASGVDSCILHYVDNNKQCQDGDVLLMDFGAEYANYAADLTRTIPVNGSFTERQKAVYNAVLRVKNEATDMLRPGITLDDYNKEVAKVVEAELIQLGLLDAKEVANQDKDKPLYKKYFMHGTSHFLGLDVHDVGHRYRPIEAGMIFTCEPGIYIKEEKIGIRIENDILVTDNQPIDLMANIPIEVEEIEDLMLAGMPF